MLQFGYGMMGHSRELIEHWGGGAVILSPRDSTSEQIIRLAADIRSLDNGSVFFDPQMYLPHSEHERLCSHSYWPADYDSGAFWHGQPLLTLLNELYFLNETIQSEGTILPGIYAPQIDDDLLNVLDSVFTTAVGMNPPSPLVGTLALSSAAIMEGEQIGDLIERCETWPIEHFYIVCEHPNGRYFVDSPVWVANILDLIAGIRLAGSRVILGYCNQQQLLTSIVKVDSIASGTWMNVRAFPPDKFEAKYDEEIRTRAKWYYCPTSLSEYKIPFLDVAHVRGVLPLMRAHEHLDGEYAEILFSGPRPTTVRFAERDAFRHFLTCMHGQVNAMDQTGFDAAVEQHESMLNEAGDLIEDLAAAGVLGQQRDFRDFIDVQRSALQLILTSRGPMLRHNWNQI